MPQPAPRLWMGFAILMLLVVGCEGCRSDDTETAEGEGDGRPAEAFLQEAPKPFPSADEEAQYAIKPGHWFTATKAIRSNRNDQRGDLRISTGILHLQEGRVRGTPGPLQASRPAVLPKGQLKKLDFRLLTGIPDSTENRRAYLRDQFVSSSQGLAFDSGETPLSAMPPEQYYFLVLTSRPGDFVSLQVADWVSPPSNAMVLDGTRRANYRVVFPSGDNLLPLPETMLDWTSTAFLLWDDVSPDRLTPAQLRAIEDWVHWGGRIIINGPAAGQEITNSNLAELLPMTVERATELDGQSFARMLTQWSVPEDDSTATQAALAEESTSRVAVDGKPHPASQPIDRTEGLVLERRVGLGNAVMTRFDLTSKNLLNWRSVQSFYNNALLRHPPRRYVKDPEAPVLLGHIGTNSTATASPLLNTSVRLFSRDGVLARLSDSRSGPSEQETAGANSSPRSTSELESWQSPGALAHPLTGAAAWTDRSDTASIALELLRKEAGIVIPPAKFVAKSLVWYLVVLVPLNFIIFRLLNRLEWAWLAVPVISIFGAVWVARAARLDIGFARSNSEIGVLEMQPDHHRAHLTSYIALYNSLSSTYRLSFESPDAAAAPVQSAQAEPGSQEPTFEYGYDVGPSLSGVTVASNRIRLMHAEQMLDVDGAIRFSDDGSRLINDSTLSLTDATIFQKDEDGQVQVAMLGLVDPATEKPLRFGEGDRTAFAPELPLQIGVLMQRMASGTVLRRGEARLVARVEDCPTALSITPSAQQQQRETVLLAHLRHAPLPKPVPDESLVPQRPRAQDLDELDLDELNSFEDDVQQ
ncbi:MAG: hypothetical protein WD119_01475 [Pirellulaceae bacterium]